MPDREINHHRKGLHGWPSGRRECTAERMLANPYNGCTHDCLACYAAALPGSAFARFRACGSITAWREFPQTVARELDALNFAAPLYLSPVADPLQPAEKELRLTEATMRAALSRGVPVDLVTKAVPDDRMLGVLAGHRHNLLQFSLPTADEDLRRRLMKGGAGVEQILAAIRQAAGMGIYTVLRLDPIYPFLTDSAENIRSTVDKAAAAGVRHIVTSVLDIPLRTREVIWQRLAEGWGAGMAESWRDLYTIRIGSYLHAHQDYRDEIFQQVRERASAAVLSFALCMEFRLDAEEHPMGMNREFATTANCEGLNIPIYRRSGEHFIPASDCNGACLTCNEAKCGIAELAMGRHGVPEKGVQLSDWRRWSRKKAFKQEMWFN